MFGVVCSDRHSNVTRPRTPHRSIHHDPATYPDPDIFRPERFLKSEDGELLLVGTEESKERGHHMYGFGRRYVRLRHSIRKISFPDPPTPPFKNACNICDIVNDTLGFPGCAPAQRWQTMPYSYSLPAFCGLSIFALPLTPLAGKRCCHLLIPRNSPREARHRESHSMPSAFCGSSPATLTHRAAIRCLSIAVFLYVPACKSSWTTCLYPLQRAARRGVNENLPYSARLRSWRRATVTAVGILACHRWSCANAGCMGKSIYSC